ESAATNAGKFIAGGGEKKRKVQGRLHPSTGDGRGEGETSFHPRQVRPGNEGQRTAAGSLLAISSDAVGQGGEGRRQQVLRQGEGGAAAEVGPRIYIATPTPAKVKILGLKILKLAMGFTTASCAHAVSLNDFFTKPTAEKYLFYLIILLYVLATSFVVVVEPYVSLPCDLEQREENRSLDFENVLYQHSDCDFQRFARLLYLSRTECLRGRHLLMAVFLGSLIG
ncbi:hypothetical protein THAOC_05925, partial [Thalassiosira oceanica]